MKGAEMISNDTMLHITLYIGAHWPCEIVPEDQLLKCVNEFLALPDPESWLELVKLGELKLSLHPDAEPGHCLQWEP
jgi:hypothetical protein